MFERTWKPGDWVIYRLSKHGVAPGPRAQHVSASRKGESYNYIVDKFWVVESISADGQLNVRTPGGKTRTLSPQDPNLRRARWWHRFQWGERFRNAEMQRRLNQSIRDGQSGGAISGGPAEAA
ncbi:MAG: hypothetical protein ACO1RT_01570 [Planctomycetaceae bacterium]